MSGCTRQTDLKLPAFGKWTVYVGTLALCSSLGPSSRISEVTHAEASKLDPSGVTPGQPARTPNVGPKPGGRIWPGLNTLTVWRSWEGKVQRMLSPVWTQSSFGKKAKAWHPDQGSPRRLSTATLQRTRCPLQFPPS